jgi:hypothetical protein
MKIIKTYLNNSKRIEIDSIYSADIKKVDQSNSRKSDYTEPSLSSECESLSSNHNSDYGSPYDHTENLDENYAELEDTIRLNFHDKDPFVAENSPEQLCAGISQIKDEKSTYNQIPEPTANDTDDAISSSIVRSTSKPRAASPSKRAANGATKARNKKRKNRKKGGWKTRRGLSWQEVKQAYKLKLLARKARLPLNRFVSIRPPAPVLARGDAKAKRWLSFAVNRIVQIVRGRCAHPRQAKVPCVTVYEKERGGAIHCHLLLHENRDDSAIERIADGTVIDVKPAINKHIGYITKQRRPQSPEFEATINHRRKSSDPIRGVLISFNTDAKDLLNKKPPYSMGTKNKKPE